MTRNKCCRNYARDLLYRFSEQMLNWPAGARASDGAWAPHWYNNVEKSTGFMPYQKKQFSLDKQAQRVVDECLPYYQTLFENRIKPAA